MVSTRLRLSVANSNNSTHTSRGWRLQPSYFGDNRKSRSARNRYNRAANRNSLRTNRRLRLHVPLRSRYCTYIKIYAIRAAA